MWVTRCLVCLLVLLPGGYFVWRVMVAGETDAATYLLVHTGTTALILLFVILLVPVLKCSFPRLLRHRRLLGVMTFAYAGFHALVYLALVLAWDFSDLVSELKDRPFVLIGGAAFVMLLLLACTSNDWSVRRLGRHWRRLHQLIYPAAVLGLFHGYWSARADYGLWMSYAGIILGILVVKRVKAFANSGRAAGKV